MGLPTNASAAARGSRERRRPPADTTRRSAPAGPPPEIRASPVRRHDCPAVQLRCGTSARLPRARTPVHGGALAYPCCGWSSAGPVAGMGLNAQLPLAVPPSELVGIGTERSPGRGGCVRDPGCTYGPMVPRPRQLEDGAMTPSDSVAAKAPPVGRTWMVGNDHRAPVIVAALDGSAPSRCTTALAAGLIKTMGWRLALVPVPLTATDADRRSRLVAAALDEHATLIASPASDHLREGSGPLRNGRRRPQPALPR